MEELGSVTHDFLPTRDETYANQSRAWTDQYFSHVEFSVGEMIFDKSVTFKAVCWVCSAREGKFVYLTTSQLDSFKWFRQHVHQQHYKLKH